jgi:hypothetical protein
MVTIEHKKQMMKQERKNYNRKIIMSRHKC